MACKPSGTRNLSDPRKDVALVKRTSYEYINLEAMTLNGHYAIHEICITEYCILYINEMRNQDIRRQQIVAKTILQTIES